MQITPSFPLGSLFQPLRLVGASMVALMLALGTSYAASAAAAADKGIVSAEDIDSLIQDRMEAHRIPGAAVAVVREGEVVHLAGYGHADPTGTPVDADTPFLIGSVSKPFTSLAVHQLVRAGDLALDQPIVPLLYDIVDDPAAGYEEVTIEHLLSHTSGLSMADGLAGTMKAHTGPDALRRRVREIMSKPLKGTPGERYEYSNAGAVLLAGVVEEVTGETFADYLGSNVFGPLGMERTFASESHPAAADLATGHRQWFGRWTPADLPYDLAGVPNGYIGSTAADLARFMQAHLDGAPDEVMPFTAGEIGDWPATPTGWDMPLEAGHSTGWFVDDFEGETVVSHAGSLGHFTTHLILAPDVNQLGIAVLTNASAFVAAGHGGQYDLSLELSRMLLGADPQPTEPGVLMTTIAPAAAWTGALAVLAAAARFLRGGRRSLTSRQHDRSWVRTVLPSVGYVGVGLALVVAFPLDAARHFYPDVGWGLTATAYFAVGWGAIRAIVVQLSRRRTRPVEPHKTVPAGQPNEFTEAHWL